MNGNAPRQVIVVGAGLAGLVAARRLCDRGADVLVLEARDRVGGRLWSHRMPNGEIVELGGEWISTSQKAVTGLANELGLGLIDTGMDFISRDPIDGPPIVTGEHERLARLLFDRMMVTGSARLSAISAKDFLDDLGESGPAMSILRSRLQGTAGAPLESIAAAEIGEEFGIGDEGSYVRVDGGNDRLAIGLTPGLDVRFGIEVVSIRQTSHYVTVTADEDFTAAALVLAVPLGVLKRLTFEPELPGEVASVIGRLTMGVGLKVAIATAEPPPMFRRQDIDIPAWYWTALGPSGTVRRAVTGFAGSEAGVTALRSDVAARLRRAAPDAIFDGAPVVADWGSDPLAGGCYSLVGPGQRAMLEMLSTPLGRVLLAGEHVNGTGTIDGAIRSGDLAANLVTSLVF
ncbi:MAG: NAD(P)/FAD-dependent oxidoreductase [Acidimicrobiia bacterium]